MKCNTAIILAAGAGTRMRSNLPKVLHPVCGKQMVEHVVRQVRMAGIDKIVLVVGHGAAAVMEACAALGVQFVMQEEQLGTGHAVLQARDHLPASGSVLILCGDTPLITGDTLAGFVDFHEAGGFEASVLTAFLEEPFGYGRILRDGKNGLTGIVEEKDATEQEKKINEINSGIFCFDAALLKNNLSRLNTDNSQSEYYITDVLTIAAREGRQTGGYPEGRPAEIAGINTRVQLASAEQILRERINRQHMLNGVTMIDPASVYIEADVTIGADSVIYPGAILTGATAVGCCCLIGHNCRIADSVIGDEVEIQSSTITKSSVGKGSTVGPYAYLRPGSRIGQNVKIGDFVEVKNAVVGDGSKASHLAYIGDADVGRDVNIGCGVVFVNYDGRDKHRSTVLDGAFVGSNSNLVAPVTVEEGAYIAAGTTVTRDVPSGALCVARAKERCIEGWAKRKHLLKNKED